MTINTLSPNYKLDRRGCQIAVCPDYCAHCAGRINKHRALDLGMKTKFCSQDCRKASYAKHAYMRFCARARVCPKCQRHLDATHFDTRRIHLTDVQVQAVCRDCSKDKDYWVDQSFTVSKNLCRVCKGVIALKVAQTIADKYVTCSRKCLSKHRRLQVVTCEMCLKTLPEEHFSRRKNGVLRKWCKHCEKTKRGSEPGFFGERPTYLRCAANVKKHARLKNKSYSLSTSQARRLWNSGCKLCGSDVGRFIHRQQGEPVNKNTIEPMCRTCANIIRYYPAADSQLIEHACKIAAHQEKAK